MDHIIVGNEKIGIIRFVLPPEVPLEQKADAAQLNLQLTQRQHGDTSVVAVQFDTQDQNEPIENGFARRFYQDQGIGSHPAVFYADQFDKLEILPLIQHKLGMLTTPWSYQDEVDYVQLDAVENKALSQQRAILARFTPNKNLAHNAEYKFASHLGSEPEEAYLRYYLYIEDNAFVSGGGKLPGFSGTYNRAGWGGRRNDGFNGWSARGTFFASVVDTNHLANHVPIGSYLYDVSDNRKYGYTIPWGHQASTLQPGKWHCIEQFIKLNTPGVSDGQLIAWVNGIRVYQNTSLNFRSTEALKIEKVWMNFYFGGTSRPSTRFDMYYDNVVIASQYIGPMGKLKTPPSEFD
ncbi:hypothetical protein GCM10009092_37460 [Bowmanella denitrificans]|uniref:Polysaccharide lyase 14 domain-containing protein n=2 Tax=Bowmanella denitrificans TaxID=366582 RepID=A0ABN0XPP3_9ALTE